MKHDADSAERLLADQRLWREDNEQRKAVQARITQEHLADFQRQLQEHARADFAWHRTLGAGGQ